MLIMSPDVEDTLQAIAILNGHTTIVPEDIEPAIDKAIVDAGGDPSNMTLRDKKRFLSNAAFGS